MGPYTNSAEFMEVLEPYVPDSLKTIIDDMYNKVVLYDHKVESVSWDFTEEDDIHVIVDFTTEKRYYDDEGKPEIVEYEGWLEIALTDRQGNIMLLDKVYVDKKENRVEFTLDQAPTNVVIDPYFITMDLAPYNNTEKIK